MFGRKPSRAYIPSDSFIVEWWSRAFSLHNYVSPHWWLVKLIPTIRDSYRFVDAWVLGHFLGSIFLFLTTSAESLRWLEWAAVRYGGLIVIEGFLYEVDILVFSGYRAAKKRKWQRVLSHRRLVITALQNYVGIIVWFALFYRHWSSGFAALTSAPGASSAATGPWLTWLWLSFCTMTSFGDPPVAPTETWTLLLTLVQSVIGVFMALLVVVSFVRLLPEPGSKTRFEQEPPPYRPVYDPRAQKRQRTSRRNAIMSSVTKESLALAAAIGAFLMAALSLLLGYALLSGLTARAGRVAPLNCCVGVWLVIFGVVATVVAAAWLGFCSWRRKPSRRQN